MHGEFQRRMAEKGLGFHGFVKRVAQVGHDGNGSGSNILPGPVTFTVTRTLDSNTEGTMAPHSTAMTSMAPHSTAMASMAPHSTAMTSMTPHSTATTSLTTSTYDNNYESPHQSMNSMLQYQPTALSGTVSTTNAAQPTLAPTPSSEASGVSTGIIAPVSGSSNARALRPGILVGVIILCLFVSIGTTIYIVRRRYVQRRTKMRKVWANSKGSRVQDTYEPKTALSPPATKSQESAMRSANADRSAAVVSFEIPGAPPASYGNVFPGAPVRNQTTPKSLVYGPPAVSSPSMATVVSTFITTLPDELSIMAGEAVRVLAEYDDGWALCVNARGEQGMIPMECLDARFVIAPGEVTVSRGLGGNLRRVSSLQPNAGMTRPF